MKKTWPLLSVLILSLALLITFPGSAFAAAKVSSGEYAAGDTVTVEGTIEPGKDLYVAVSMQALFAPKDTTGPHEVKRLKKDILTPMEDWAVQLS